MIKVGDHLPEATLFEFFDVEANGCSVGPNAFKTADLVKGKKIAVFGLPGAFTPTCSAQHVPGYVKHIADLKAVENGRFSNHHSGSTYTSITLSESYRMCSSRNTCKLITTLPGHAIQGILIRCSTHSGCYH